MPDNPDMCGGGIQPKIIEESHVVGGIGEKRSNGGTQYYQQDRVLKGDVAMCHPANIPGGSYNYIVAMRGRNRDNPSDRSRGQDLEQRLEVNMNGTSNALTTVQKDNMVLEGARYRIRKLTPKECFRLMGVTDEDADKMLAVNSNTQCYKQAGNSIVVDVMCAMFRRLF